MEGNKMSTFKRIFGKATKRLSSSPQREGKNSSHKNFDARPVNTIASEVSKDSNSEWNQSMKDEWKCDSESGSNISPTPTAPFIIEETPSRPGLLPKEQLLELAIDGSGQETEVAKDAAETPTFILDKELGAEEHSQRLWSNLNGTGSTLNETIQEISVTQRVISDSMVSEDGDGVKMARSEGAEQQMGFSTRLRQRGDGSGNRKGENGEEKRRSHHRRHHRDEKVPEDPLKLSGKKRAVVYASREDLKRTATLPTLQRSSKMQSSSFAKEGSSAGLSSGSNRQSPSESHLNNRNESATVRTARSVIVSNRTETSSPSGKLLSSSSDAEGSGTWSTTSEKKGIPFSSSSLMVVESNMKRKLSVSDVQRMFEEFTKMQHDMHVLIGNNESMWHRYEDDVAQLREEIDAVYVEVGNLTSELERCSKERSQCWNLDEKMLLSSVTVKTGRSSLTLHSGEAAEVAIAEQLQQMEEDGPLVPFEGNQLMVLSSRSHNLFLNKVKPDTEGSFIRRGLMRAVLEVSSKARRLWSVYTRMYPAL